jgi:hypothetical protein
MSLRKAFVVTSGSSHFGFLGGGAIISSPGRIFVEKCGSGCCLLAEDDPRRGISFRAWKFLGLRPLTTIGAVDVSHTFIFVPLARVATTFK